MNDCESESLRLVRYTHGFYAVFCTSAEDVCAGRDVVIYKPEQRLGLRALRLAEDGLGQPLPVHATSLVVPALRCSAVGLSLSRGDAHALGLQETNLTRVHVPLHSLNAYVDLAWRFDWEGDKLLGATPYWYLNRPALLEAWRRAGFPATWDPVAEVGDEP